METEKYNKIFNYIVQKIKTNDYSDDLPMDIGLQYYTFTKNFFNYIGVSEYSELLDYAPEALDYIDKTFPYCFMRVDNKTVDDAIKLYVISQGGTNEQVPTIIEHLKKTKMTHINQEEISSKNELSEMYEDEQPLTIGDIAGTSVSSYQQDNLYDVLVAINDKNINSYINYLVVNNVFNDEQRFRKVFKGMFITIDKEGNKYINEGNHRTFTYLLLSKIRSYLNVENNSQNFQVISTIKKEQELSETRQRGK